jgi:hypothetical protein
LAQIKYTLIPLGIGLKLAKSWQVYQEFLQQT